MDDNWDDGESTPSAPVIQNFGTSFGTGRGFKPATQNNNNNYSPNSSGVGTLDDDSSSGDRRPGDYGGGNRNFDNRDNGFGNKGFGSKGFDSNDNQSGGFKSSQGFGNNYQDKGFGDSNGFGSKGFGSKGFGNDDFGDDNGGGGGGGRGGRGRGRGGRGGGNRGFGDDNGGGGGGGGFGDSNGDWGNRGRGGRGGRGGGRGGGNRGFGDSGGDGFGDDNGDRGSRGRGGRGGGRGGGNRGFGDDGGGGGGGGGYGNRGFGDDNGGGSKGFGSRGFDDDNGGGSKGFGSKGFGDDNDGGFGGGGGGGFGDGEGGGRGRGRGRGRGGRGGGGGDGGGRRFDDNNDGGGGGGGDGDQPEKPREIYIPPERSDDDATLFGSGVKAGINFSKYDSIEVNTNGENVPPPIKTFEEANLRNLLNDNIKKSGYSIPTPVQKYAIPILLAERDLMACAQTGSGKTAAFMIPIIHKLLAKSRDIDMAAANNVEPRALIVSPTRELAIQIYDEARKFSKGSILKCHVVYGGTSTGHQTRQIFSGCDILVATPGRLLDMVGRGKITFGQIEFVVLDEADRMLDMGFIGDVEKVIRHDTMVPCGERQTLMFSATFPEEVQQLAAKFLNNYIFVAVGIVGSACTDVEQTFVEVGKKDKRAKLKELMESEVSQNSLKGIMVFVDQKRTADFIAAFLSENNFPTTSIHGDRLQREREEALSDFKTGKMGIIVATAVAARGLDIPNVRHVINYDLPKEIDEYIHRIGRTGRVGNKGKATSFYDGSIDSRIQSDLVKILTQAKQEIPDWLSSGASGGSYGAAPNFGARDIRDFSDVQSSSGGAAQPVEQEEEW